MDAKSKSSHDTSKVIPSQSIKNKMMEALSSALCLDAERILRVDIKRYSYDELIKMKNALKTSRGKKTKTIKINSETVIEARKTQSVKEKVGKEELISNKSSSNEVQKCR